MSANWQQQQHGGSHDYSGGGSGGQQYVAGGRQPPLQSGSSFGRASSMNSSFGEYDSLSHHAHYGRTVSNIGDGMSSALPGGIGSLSMGYSQAPPPPPVGLNPFPQHGMGGWGSGAVNMPSGGSYHSVWGMSPSAPGGTHVMAPPGLYGGGGGSKAPAVGWGGQAIQDNRGQKHQGRGRRGGHYQGAGRGGSNDWGNTGWPSTASFGSGGGSNSSSRSNSSYDERQAAEELLRMLQSSAGGSRSGHAPIPPAVFDSLELFNGRRLSFVLKELARTGAAGRAVQLFEALQRMGPPLGQLCDTYTYTAMVSVCIHSHDVQHALRLLADMKARGVECSVHTYTALMNVCIKCGKGQLALDAYQAMMADGLQPNVITYNTLVDVYGKMGAWQQAVGVLQVMRERSVEPVLRTYNTVMIACNICGQPREALTLYERMRADGFSPNATTYNTLITAYGKVGQLDRAMEAFQEMRTKGYPRSVVTYSTLISACERVGQWRRALDLFAEMRPDGCSPNTVTYNSLIKACSQGAQWEKALELFETMGTEGCRPDVVTFTALINACDRSGQWRTALAMFERMRGCGCKPDAIVYNAVIDCLWETGIASAQCQALLLFQEAQKAGHFVHRGLDALLQGHAASRAEVNLHAQTAGVAMLGLYGWLVALYCHVAGGGALPDTVAIVTDSGRGAREIANNVVKGAVGCLVPAWGAPFRAAAEAPHGRVLEAPGEAVAEWLLSSAFEAHLCVFFPCAAADEQCRAVCHALRQCTTPPQADATEARCSEAFSAIKRFEQTHALSLQSMSLSYLEARPELVSFALSLRGPLEVGPEVLHDAVLLMDRLASTGAVVQPDQLYVMMAACVKVSAGKSSGADGRFLDRLERATGMLSSAIANAEQDLHSALDGDTAAISALRCLQVYLERMGCEFQDQGPLESMVSIPSQLVADSLHDTTFLNCRPSVVAAAVLCRVRRCRGIVPYWPSVLAKMTGYRDMSSPEIAVAVKAAHRLYIEWAGRHAVPLLFDRSDSSCSGGALGGSLGGSRGASPRGGSPVMWAMGTSPPGGAALGPDILSMASYASSESSQSANGISPGQSPSGGMSPRDGVYPSELNLAALSLSG
mmetsp:Transcript_3237/g.8115  ORF Transcript_3237/g.8115 Transcript_3237/m.8115 type:complete len:1105 (+) Transcript_3237:237-3551(+)